MPSDLNFNNGYTMSLSYDQTLNIKDPSFDMHIGEYELGSLSTE
jgi:hypothetical protein